MDKKREIEEKSERILRMLREENLGGLLIGAQHNFAWITAGGSNGIDMSREAGAGALFIRRDGRKFVLANSIEMPRLTAEELEGQGYEPVEFAWEDEKSNAAFVGERARALIENGGSFGSDLPVADKSCRVVENQLASARASLTDAEIGRMRELGRDAGRALEEVARGLEPGLTEMEISRRTRDALAIRGAFGVALLVAADERLKRFRHPAPTAREWREIVMIVACARRGGLIVSLTRIVSNGEVPGDLISRTSATAQVNADLYAATKPGVTGRELYEVAARAYAAAGFPGEERLHHQGGASGYRTRDWVAHPRCEEQVQINQAFAWNPSITGTKVEETCIAFADHQEIVTASPGWPQITVEAEGCEYIFPGVLSLGRH